MKTSIATVSVAGTLQEKLEAIAAAGFDGVEIFEQDFIASDIAPADLGRMVRDHGLEITLFQPFRDFEGLPAPLRDRAFARARRKFDLMCEIGADLVLVCSSVHPESMGGIDRLADDFAELGTIAAAQGLRVGFEALAWGRHINDHRDAWEVVRRADHPAVGLILDSFHTLGRGIAPDTIRAIPGDRIFFVQLADAPKIEMDLLYWSRHFRNMPGEGDLDVTGFMRAVAATGYKGPLSLEVFNDEFRAGLPRLVALDGHRSLVALMDRVRRAEPALSVDLPAFPPPEPVKRVAFVEFATSADEAPQLATLLETLGFAEAGNHRSKPVRRFRQGDINILMNTATDGFAHTAYVNHGTCVSEIALAVPDAKAVFARGVALRADPFGDGPGPGELSIPGLRGVGGSLLRLVDTGDSAASLWKVDFLTAGLVETEGEGPMGAGLTAIDHIAQTMPYDEMLSWTLFYSTLFEAEKMPMLDVADPDGLVRSQAVRAGALRVTLNGAQGPRTLAGRFLTDSFGAATQHIAFATDDILATADRLAELGFAALPIGANYYDDLAARFGLPPERIAALKARNILYDRDEAVPGSAFFQLYGRPFADGMFFEIVERRGGYDGYGAANAPFRLAAQRRLARPSGFPRV
ncbi:bifunctional sugar phosphate isomerase/epimerase/4-hydroxyphenylpyruvate dioxygenase family protein [Pararhodobacter sp.]|uniref:bifunctional sugar phosphate isomerase/epimerase/4-hydroxyphenylpyruvate dioxygenase family protein n=1 Tax=Pararhodobacter sp. TaxID=2127056 RepID=UPI002FDDBEEC